MYGASALQTTLSTTSPALRRTAADSARIAAVERVRPAREELARATRDAEEQFLEQRRRQDRDRPDGPHGFSRPLSPSGFHAQLLAQLTEDERNAPPTDALSAYPAEPEADQPDILPPGLLPGDGDFAPGEVRISLNILV